MLKDFVDGRTWLSDLCNEMREIRLGALNWRHCLAAGRHAKVIISSWLDAAEGAVDTHSCPRG